MGACNLGIGGGSPRFFWGSQSLWIGTASGTWERQVQACWMGEVYSHYQASRGLVQGLRELRSPLGPPEELLSWMQGSEVIRSSHGKPSAHCVYGMGSWACAAACSPRGMAEGAWRERFTTCGGPLISGAIGRGASESRCGCGARDRGCREARDWEEKVSGAILSAPPGDMLGIIK